MQMTCFDVKYERFSAFFFEKSLWNVKLFLYLQMI